ncbi:hypothetical protein ES332_D01G227500v1 [Gossypium tomentosum]|uniref:Uncharacterized protein n=1 Tax=Gossypium tomentosum TaxID=34277 RepID=A0A5D2MCR9_GOSTO|nr:hypothetical protein ES332_D01G227500v1 [Gossypium tomentosum]
MKNGRRWRRALLLATNWVSDVSSFVGDFERGNNKNEEKMEKGRRKKPMVGLMVATQLVDDEGRS